MRGNTVSIKGNVTRDMEVRRTNSGSNACSWGIAWNDRKKNRSTGEYEDVPNFFDVECWASDGQLRQLQGQVVKGARCAIVDGHVEQQTWESNGQKRSKVVIRVDDPISGLMCASGQARRQESVQESYYDEDIPF